MGFVCVWFLNPGKGDVHRDYEESGLLPHFNFSFLLAAVFVNAELFQVVLS